MTREEKWVLSVRKSKSNFIGPFDLRASLRHNRSLLKGSIARRSSSVYSKRSCRDRGLRCAVCMYDSICRRILQQKNITQARLYRCWRKKNSCVRNRGFYTSKLPLPSRSKHTKDSIGSNSEFFSFSHTLWRKDDRWVSHSNHSTRIFTQHDFYRTSNEIGSNDFSPSSGSWGADLVSFQTYRKKTHYGAACTHRPFFWGQSDRPTFL